MTDFCMDIKTNTHSWTSSYVLQKAAEYDKDGDGKVCQAELLFTNQEEFFRFMFELTSSTPLVIEYGDKKILKSQLDALQLLAKQNGLDIKTIMDRAEVDQGMVVNLNLSGLPVENLAALHSLVCLSTLSLSGTKVVDISALAELTELKALNLANTPLSNISPMGTNASLERLVLTGSKVKDISSITRLYLVALYLDNTPFSDVEQLYKFQHLQEVNVYQSQADPFEVDRLSEVHKKITVMF